MPGWDIKVVDNYGKGAPASPTQYVSIANFTARGGTR